MIKKQLNISILDLYNFYKLHPNFRGNIKVKTRFGYYPVNDCQITSFNSDVIEIKTEYNKTIKTSPDHLLLNQTNNWVKVKNLSLNDYLFTEDDLEKIVSIKKLSYKKDLYDIEVSNKHEYYANGIVSHNSQLFSSVLYALFGQLQSKIKNENIITKPSAGKSMDVALLFSVDGIFYKVRRGISKSKASYLELFRVDNGNDVDITKSTIAETQQEIEDNLLHCDATMFLRTMLLTSDQTYNFYMMKKADKKDFVEKMFDIAVFEEMHKALHKDVLSLEKDSIASQNRMLMLNKAIEEHEARISKYEEKRKYDAKSLQEDASKLEAKLDELKHTEVKSNAKAIKAIEDEIEYIEESISKSQAIVDEKNAKLMSLKHEKMKNDSSLATLSESKQMKQKVVSKHKDILAKLCNDCKKVFVKHYSIDVIASEIKSICNEEDGIKAQNEEISSKMSSISPEIANEKSLISSNREKALDAKANMKKLLEESMSTSNEIARIESQLKSVAMNIAKVKSEANPYEEALSKSKKDLSDESSQLKKVELRLKYLKFAESIVSQDTLRKFIIKDLVVLLNNKIKTYLTKLGAKYYVVFNEDMDYEFVTPSGECEWSNFSAGERMRIMVATSFAFRDFMSIRNGLNANILVLDEYFDSAIDSLCVESIISILKDYASSQKQNIFVISHRPEVSLEMFDRTILVEKTNGIASVHIN